MTTGSKPGWDEGVAAQLLALGKDAGAKPGHMFGHPALYASGKLAACAYGDGVGLKLPEARVSELLEAGGGRPFQPYGKAPMREWIHLSVTGPSAQPELEQLVIEAVAFTGVGSGRSTS